MLIISKYRDYYDKIVGVDGIDKTLVFKRNIIEIEDIKADVININYNMPCNIGCSLYSEKITKKNPIYTSFIIGFCGKLYIGYKFEWIENIKDEEIKKSEILYDKEKIIAKIIKNKNPNRAKKLKQQLEDVYNNIHFKDYYEKFQIQNIPYFYAKKYKSTTNNTYFRILKLNPILNDYDFFKMFDPFTAFQEISMFLGGVLCINEKETLEIDDKYRMAASGYDKTSFRQSAPGIKKEQRRANKLKKKLKKLKNEKK
jgi:hypothetical protein